MSVKNQDQNPATRGELQRVADDVKELRRGFALEIVKTNARIDKLGEDIRAEMRAMSSGLHKKIDGFMSQSGKVDRAQVIADWRLTELEKRVSAIEPRPS